MEYRNINNVICFEGIKNAALYFDRVIPMSFRQLKSVKEGAEFLIPEKVTHQAFSQIVFGTEAPSGEERFRHAAEYFSHWHCNYLQVIRSSRPKRNVNKYVGDQEHEYDDYEDVKKMYLQNVTLENGKSIRQVFHEFAKHIGVDYASVLLKNESKDDGFEYTSMSLLNLPMIDAESADWDQILELRKDKEASSNLRRLRLFLHTNYEGKSIDYVEDDLMKRIEDYDETRRSLGFKALVSSLGILLDSKSLQASASGGLAAMLLGGPVAGITTAAIIEVGQISVEIAKQRHAIREFENGHEMAYLVEARSKMDE